MNKSSGKSTRKASVKPSGALAKKEVCCRPGVHHHCGGAIYGLGFIGALVYYMSTATGFWNGVLGVLKAIVWPAFVVYSLMKSLGM